MVNDTYISQHVRLYMAAVAVLLLMMFGGAFYFSQSPFFSIANFISTLKEPFYKAEFYLDKQGLAGALFARDAASSDSAASVPVLVYHGIVEEINPDNSGDVTIEQFRDHMQSLKQAGYHSIGLEEFLAFVKGGKELPARSVLITFDDGRRDSYYNGDPILSALGYSAVMYVIGMFTHTSADAIGDYYLSDEEISMMEDSDTWEVGSHSYNGHREVAKNAEGTDLTYFFGGRIWNAEENRIETFSEFRARVAEDLRSSKEVLEIITETPVTTLAFPFGNYGESTQEDEAEREIKNIVLEEADRRYELLFYQTAPYQYFTQAYAIESLESRDRSLVRRIRISNELDGATLVKNLEKGLGKRLPFTASFTDTEGWVEAWGKRTFTDGALILDGKPSKAGAGTVLDGTRHWTDYRVEADVISHNGASVVLMLRYDSEGNNVSCNYGKDFVHINQRIDGTERVVRGVDGIAVIGANEAVSIQVAGEVEGRRVACLLNGETVVETTFIDPSLTRGGVGWKTWNQSDDAEIVIHSFSAAPLGEEE